MPIFSDWGHAPEHEGTPSVFERHRDKFVKGGLIAFVTIALLSTCYRACSHSEQDASKPNPKAVAEQKAKKQLAEDNSRTSQGFLPQCADSKPLVSDESAEFCKVYVRPDCTVGPVTLPANWKRVQGKSPGWVAFYFQGFFGPYQVRLKDNKSVDLNTHPRTFEIAGEEGWVYFQRVGPPADIPEMKPDKSGTKTASTDSATDKLFKAVGMKTPAEIAKEREEDKKHNPTDAYYKRREECKEKNALRAENGPPGAVFLPCI